MKPHSPVTALSTNRIEGLQDAFFAIVMTLLILELKVPEVGDGESLIWAMVDIVPHFFSYFLSFVMLAVYWVGHHNQFHYIERTDRLLLWLDLLFLFVVSLIPFSTAFMNAHADLYIPHAVYGLNIAFIGLVSLLHWAYASHHHRLTSHDLSPAMIRAVRLRILVAPVFSILGTVAWFIHPILSFVTFLCIPAIYILPGRIDQHWKQPAIPHEHHPHDAEASEIGQLHQH